MKSVVISIIQSVHKTNSSDGNWAVTALVKFPWVTTEYTFFSLIRMTQKGYSWLYI